MDKINFGVPPSQREPADPQKTQGIPKPIQTNTVGVQVNSPAAKPAVSPAVKSSGQLSADQQLLAPAFEESVQICEDDLHKMLVYSLENRADDLILLTGYPWSIIWSERVVRLGTRALWYEEMETLLCTITRNRNASIDLKKNMAIDFTYTVSVGRNQRLRFRCNATGALGSRGGDGMSIVFRPMGKVPPTMSEIGLPVDVQAAALPKNGIVIVCGPTGSGKTTTLDSFMRAHATAPQGKHIITYYAPIENDLSVIPGQTGLIAQTEIGREGYGAHLPSFAEAVRNSLRRHPMVIAYGEARDAATIEGAVLSSMTGHATYTTTHTSNVHMTIPRMSDAFSGSERVRISNALIDNTRLILHQRLLKRPGGIGRAPVRSWLIFDQSVRSYLLKVPIDDLPAAIRELTEKRGRSLMADARAQYQKGLIHEDEMQALENELANFD